MFVWIQQTHREDLFNKMKENKLVDDNVVGSYDPRYPNAKYEPTELGVRDGVRGLNDRTVAIQWITNCKVWIANETWWEGNGAHSRTHYRKNLEVHTIWFAYF